jgi:hypothetical protein
LGRPSDQHGQHLAVVDASFLERLAIVVEGAAVKIELLRLGREVCFACNEALEVLDRQARWEIKSQQLLIRGLVWSVDGYGDAWPENVPRKRRI